ncbi:CPBP family intramembrane metalloprotease [Chryseobacterium sp. SSA4.19]|uniref:CPBP family intramembrane glutamic endopeptidase n=1 Tax=Chryseobacterium sp. SSA4.19 TaxID=2919915 RepID=UPI001F4DEFFE|nr:type II CAAX endopeptidase family protein [Chryseobacterium sp. SSA4.19]MCJ8154536.1 CPBP family intramembrane metalloprotease [Chryseobacterium sp. SSA4.19]
METHTTKQKILNLTITKIVLALLIFMAVVVIGQQIASKLLALTPLDRDYRNLLKGILISTAAVSTYIFLFKKYEKRSINEFSGKGLVKNLIMGSAIGFALQSLVILVIYINGYYQITAVNPVSFILIPLALMFTVAIIEEILVRGIIFRLLEEKLGSYLALAISSLIFGGLHLANPNSNFLSTLCITTAGFLLGSAFIYRRNLWFPIALHFAWNFTQSGIYGAITSGNEKTTGWLTTEIKGPDIITGGAFGPEGSIQATVICLMATVFLLILSHRNNQIIAKSKK